MRLVKSAWERKEFRRFPLQKLCYSTLRADFPLTAQIVVRLIAKVSDAYKLDQKVQREFRPHGSISYDLRVLSWNMSKETVSIWSLDGGLSIPFVCGEHHRELLNFQRGETDLVYRDKEWFLFTTVHQTLGGLRGFLLEFAPQASVASPSTVHSGSSESRAVRRFSYRDNPHVDAHPLDRLALLLIRHVNRRRRKERRFATDVNHQISKKIVGAAKRTECRIALRISKAPAVG
jgi:putative transposase